jgi:hypothetical protein
MAIRKDATCRICERPLWKHTGADLDRCELTADGNEVLRRLTERAVADRVRKERFLEKPASPKE